jgi:predicted nucleic acid-binding protein
VIVADAGVVLNAIADDTPDGARVRRRLADESACAPELLDVEVLSALRRLVASGELSPSRAELAIADLGVLDIDRVPHASLLRRCWELRENVTPYDAVYVALAEAHRATLVTGDRKLAAAPGPRCTFEVL